MSAQPPTPRCRVCGSAEVAEWLRPREMMFGRREQFSYFRCAACGCLQIDRVPANLGDYYPATYYSYDRPPGGAGSFKAVLKRKFVAPHLTRHLLGWGSVRGRLFAGILRPATIPPWLGFMARPLSFTGAVLDVGCGSGANLLMLRDCGFSDLRGIDPFLPASAEYDGGVRVDKCRLEDANGQYELVMFHHVFEHVEDPKATLREARRLLAPRGQILIRIPLADSDAAARYRENWVQLDAPRHIALQTRQSMAVLAQQAGLKISRVEYDSSAFQFWGSEQYARDIPLVDARSYQTDKSASVFRAEQINEFSNEAERLNREGRGDQAAFVLEAANL